MRLGTILLVATTLLPGCEVNLNHEGLTARDLKTFKVTGQAELVLNTFDGAIERYRPHRCGGRKSFRIGDRMEWSYLLPRRLPKGRYTIRAVAIDKRGNDSVTRVVIRVR